jgi:MYXO-CTERM domain-containing protein
MKSKLMAAAALVAMGGAAQAQLVNGSFETPAAPGSAPFYAAYANGADIGGWTVVGCGVACASDAVTLLNNQAATLPGLTGHVTPYGNQWIDLTGDGNFGLSSVTQTIGGLVAGTVYTLSFALGATNLHDAVVSVTAPGASGTFTTFASGSAGGFANVWNTYSLNFTAGASNTLTFTGVAASGGPTSIGLDNITVTAVPEPSAYAMALAGLGALGFMARRRKSRA